MSAELLRQAAKTLREHAERATAPPWNASPVDSPDAIVTSAVYSFAHRTGTPESEVVGAVRKGPRRGGGIRTGGDARYIALMHPPVALALAAHLDDLAERAEEHPGLRGIPDLCPCSEVDGWHQSVNVARAILREES